LIAASQTDTGLSERQTPGSTSRSRSGSVRLAERPQRDVGVKEDAPQLLIQA
jgi:hypothetical protein